jgi:SSS family solute:Na+ symporter
MLGLFLLGFLSKKVKNIDAAIGVICGVVVIAWISAAKWLNLPETGVHEYLAIVFGTMTIFLVGFLLAKLRK